MERVPFLPGSDPSDLTSSEFERLVVSLLTKTGAALEGFAVGHQTSIAGASGEYVFDAVANFEALGVSFVVLIECKHTKRPVPRSDVQVLSDKLRDVGAHKGILFSTAGFQSGAIDLARHRGIALVVVREDSGGVVLGWNDADVSPDDSTHQLAEAEQADRLLSDHLAQLVRLVDDVNGERFFRGQLIWHGPKGYWYPTLDQHGARWLMNVLVGLSLSG